ncbi:MAG: hypothetical protein IJP17_04025 [Clostridia bacterium]|nr:hypothetical protein [Clostridia bacterium]
MEEKNIPEVDTTPSAEDASTEEYYDAPVFIFDDEDRNDEEIAPVPEIRSIHSEAAKTVSSEDRSGTKVKEKKTFGEFVANLVYHHKFGLFVTVFAIFVLVLIIVDLIPDNNDADLILYATNESLENETGELAELFSKYVDDVNGNGEREVGVIFYDKFSQDYTKVIAATAYMMTEFADSFENPLFITDKTHYDFLVENYGEELFESYNGAPRWIDLGACPPVAEYRKAHGIDVELGLCLVHLTDEMAADEDIAARHATAVRILEAFLADYPELLAQ